METSADFPAFALPSESQETNDGDSKDVSPRDTLNDGALHSTDASPLPAEVPYDLLGFGTDHLIATPGPIKESNDLLDLFSTPVQTSAQQPPSHNHILAVDPFMDFITKSPPTVLTSACETPDNLGLFTDSKDAVNGLDITKPAAPSPANQIFNSSVSNMISLPANPLTSMQPVQGEPTLTKLQLELTQETASPQTEQIASIEAQKHVNSLNSAANQNQDETIVVQQDGDKLQQDGNQKDKIMDDLQNNIDIALVTNSASLPDASTGTSEELERLQQALDQAHQQLRQEQEAAAEKLRQADAVRLQEVADLHRQLDEATKRVEGFKTDQVRYRELQSLWSTEQTKRVQAEERAESAELTVDELRKVVEQQGNDLKLLHDKVAAVKKEADERAEAAEENVKSLEELMQQQKTELSNLQEAAHAAATEECPDAVDEMRRLQLELETKAVELERSQKELNFCREQMSQKETEFDLLKADHDEQHRREMALTSRLNAAKKTEAEKIEISERLEDELKAVTEALEVHKLELKNAQIDKDQLENALEKLKRSTHAKLADAEAALKDERTLNEERKRKMKAFVETKSDELRQLQADNDALQSEVVTTSKSLMDLNTRWKQLHAQWVQSQTRNRELQRDLNRMKKDSESLHKAGDTIQMKLSRSTNETEEHKHKRLAAKHELMTVLRTLEAERELTNRLRDNIKYTFTPKSLSQQQLIHEALEEFENQLLKLAQRLSVPLPPTSNSVSPMDLSDGVPGIETATLDDDVAKLDHETQRVSQSIMSLSDNVERLRVMLDMGGGRSCASVLTELFTTGGMHSSPAIAADDRAPMTGSRMNAVRSHRYGYVPGGSR
jgi:hypothetical protein